LIAHQLSCGRSRPPAITRWAALTCHTVALATRRTLAAAFNRLKAAPRMQPVLKARLVASARARATAMTANRVLAIVAALDEGGLEPQNS
jgi:hypothetical protein